MKHVALKAAIHVTVAAVAVGGTLLAVRARAAGVPDADALTYTGYLENPDGTAATGKHLISVRLLASADANKAACSADGGEVDLVAGRFQVPLPDCTDVVKANPNLFVEVQVDGAWLGATRLGAVPYAIEAGHATRADSADAASGALDTRLGAVEARATKLEDGLLSKSATAVHLNQGQVYANGVGGTVLFDQKDLDLGSEYSAATGKFTSKTGGIYDVSCNLQWKVTAAGTNTYFQTTIWLNQNSSTGVQQETMSDGLYPTIEAHGVIKLKANDTLHCQAYQQSGVSLPLNNDAVSVNRFSVVRLSP